MAWPRFIVDWEMVGRITILVQAEWVMPLAEQDEEVAGYFYDGYQQLVVPARVQGVKSPIIDPNNLNAEGARKLGIPPGLLGKK